MIEKLAYALGYRLRNLIEIFFSCLFFFGMLMYSIYESVILNKKRFIEIANDVEMLHSSKDFTGLVEIFALGILFIIFILALIFI